jgi:hypothetical protein
MDDLPESARVMTWLDYALIGGIVVFLFLMLTLDRRL